MTPNYAQPGRTRPKRRRRPRRERGRTDTFHPLVRLKSDLTIPLVASLFYIFVEYARPQEKYAIVGGMPLGQVSLAILILSVILFTKGPSWGGTPGKFLLAFLVWALPCALLAGNPDRAMESYTETLKILPVYYLLLASVRTRSQLYLLILGILLVFFYHTNFSLRQWALSGFSGLPKGTYVGSGFVQNPNDYGAWMCSFWGVSLALALKDRWKLFGRIDVRWIHGLGTVLIVLGVLISSSRGSAVGLAVGVLYFVFVNVRSVKAKLGGAAVAVVAVALFAALMSEGQAARYQNMGSEEDESAQDRIRTWRVAVEVAQDHPVTGVGIGEFLPVGLRYAQGERIFVQHNITLQALTDTGVPGLLLMSGLVLSFFWQQRKIKKRARRNGDTFVEALSAGVTLSMVSFLVNGQFITVLYYPFMWMLLAVGGILYNLSLEPPRARAAHSLRRSPQRRSRGSRSAPTSAPPLW